MTAVHCPCAEGAEELWEDPQGILHDADAEHSVPV